MDVLFDVVVRAPSAPDQVFPSAVTFERPRISQALFARRASSLGSFTSVFLRGNDLAFSPEAWLARGLAPPSSSQLEVAVGAQRCLSPAVESHDLVSCLLPAEAEGRGLLVSAQVGGLVNSTAAHAFLGAPQIVSMSPSVLFLPINDSVPLSVNVTFRGVRFGREVAIITSLAIAGVPCPRLARRSDSELDCVGLSLVALRGAVSPLNATTDAVDALVSFSWGEPGFEATVQHSSPLVLSVRPRVESAVPFAIQPLETFSILGSGLGWASSDISNVRVGPSSCLPWTFVSPNALLCRAPPINVIGMDPNFPRVFVRVEFKSGAASTEEVFIEYPRTLFVGFVEEQLPRLLAFPSGFSVEQYISIAPPPALVANQVAPSRCWLEVVTSIGGLMLVGNTSYALQVTVDDLPLRVSFPSISVLGSWGSSALLRAVCSPPSGDVESSALLVNVTVATPSLTWNRDVEDWPVVMAPETLTPPVSFEFTLSDADRATLDTVSHLFECTAVLHEGANSTSPETSLSSLLDSVLLNRTRLSAPIWSFRGDTASGTVTIPALGIGAPSLGSTLLLEVECEWIPNQARFRLPPVHTATIKPEIIWSDDGAETISLSGVSQEWGVRVSSVPATPSAARSACSLEKDSQDVAGSIEARIELAATVPPRADWSALLTGVVIGPSKSSILIRASCSFWGQFVRSAPRRLTVDELVVVPVRAFPTLFLPSSASSFFFLDPPPSIRVLSSFRGSALVTDITCSMRSRNVSSVATVDGPAAFFPSPNSDGEVVFANVAIRSRFGLEGPVVVEVSCSTLQLHRATPLQIALQPLRLETRWCSVPDEVAQSQSPMDPWAIALIDAAAPESHAGSCAALRAPPEWASRTTSALTCSVAEMGVVEAESSETVLQNAYAFPDPQTWQVRFDAFSLAGYQGSTYELGVLCQLGSLPIPPTLRFSVTLLGCGPGEEPQGFFCRKCGAGSFSLGGVGEVCVGCPSRGVSCTNGIISLQPGYYRAESQRESPLGPTAELHPCWNKEACIVDAENLTYGCAFGYEGPLCGVCDRDVNYERFGNACTECWPRSASLLVLSLILLVFFGLSGVLAIRDSNGRRSDNAIMLRILLSFLQGLGALGVFKARGTDTFRQVFGFADGVSMNPFSLGPIQCLFGASFLAQFLSILLLPFLAAISVVFFFIVATLVRKCRQSFRRWMGRDLDAPDIVPSVLIAGFFRDRKYLASFSFLAFLAYMPMVNQSFQALDCYDEPIDGVSRLQQDLSEECREPFRVFLAALVLLVVGVGLPLGLFLFLRRRTEAELLNPRFMDHFGFLFDGYDVHRKLAWWESVVLARKAGIVMLATLVTDAFVQLAGALLLLAGSLWLNERSRPYSKYRFVKVESESLAVLFITAAMSLIYFRDIEDENGNIEESATPLNLALTVILVLLNIAMVGRLLFEVLRKQSLQLIRTTEIGRRIAVAAHVNLLSAKTTLGPSFRRAGLSAPKMPPTAEEDKPERKSFEPITATEVVRKLRKSIAVRRSGADYTVAPRLSTVVRISAEKRNK